MCGRYVSPDEASIEREFDLPASGWSFPRSFNVAPSQSVPVIRREDGGARAARLRWGLVPFFAKGVPGKYSTINARVESIETSASYRGPWKRGQRCIVPALGFYEWHLQADGTKQPFYIHLSDQALFGFAGLWDRSQREDGEAIESFTIITLPANPLMAEIHNTKARMPAILAASSAALGSRAMRPRRERRWPATPSSAWPPTRSVRASTRRATMTPICSIRRPKRPISRPIFDAVPIAAGPAALVLRVEDRGPMRARVIVCLMVLLPAVGLAAQGRIYTFIDADGVRHYTDVPDDNRYRRLVLSPQDRTESGQAYDERLLARASRYDPMIEGAAAAVALAPDLLRAVIVVESGFNSRAVSKKGAVGLMQLMPATGLRYGVSNLYDPRQNVHAGAAYLKYLIDRFGHDLPLALAAYNAGEDAVQRNGGQIPPFSETQAYVPRVMSIYHLLIRRGRAS